MMEKDWSKISIMRNIVKSRVESANQTPALSYGIKKDNKMFVLSFFHR